MLRVWAPWLILSVFVFAWGIPAAKAALDGALVQVLPDRRPARDGAEGAAGRGATAEAEKAVYKFNILSATGTSIFLAAHRLGLRAGLRPAGIVQMYAAHALDGALLAAHDRGHAGDRLRHALLGHRRHDGSAAGQHRLPLSLLRHPDRLARRGADRLGYGVQRAVRRPAEGHRASSSASIPC